MAREKYIPANHGEGQAVAGVIIKTRNLFEGVLMGGIPFALIMYYGRDLSFSDAVTIAVIVSGPLLYLGLNGINGDSFTVFIKVWFKFNKHRRILFYNPRVKSEAVPLIFEKRDEEATPKDKILKYVDGKRDTYRKKRIARNELTVTQTQDGPVFFEDDIGILEKPDEYKSVRELRAEARKKK